eukprot:gb/GEZJ01003149.1/.p1 GENE.gb/GEZJ01003149.1/~~gb/GEZJ01003149.1/.p1  ORF type:complete len:136 (-),score=18.36 gb/GEZJ01003149.1/:1527-1934(-)
MLHTTIKISYFISDWGRDGIERFSSRNLEVHFESQKIGVDAVSNEDELVMHVISEHVKKAGVYSGDASLMLPPQDLDEITVQKVGKATANVVRALNVTAPMNNQFTANNNAIKVVERNLRALRTFPSSQRQSVSI